MGPSMRVELVCRALRMAMEARNPAAGLILHSDRSAQYTSHEYPYLLKKNGIVCSMSLKGNCWERQRGDGTVLLEFKDGACLAT